MHFQKIAFKRFITEITFVHCTVKPVYNDHTWDLKNMVLMLGVVRKDQWQVSFALVVMASNWPLLTGSCYSELVVSTGLTLFEKDSEFCLGNY